MGKCALYMDTVIMSSVEQSQLLELIEKSDKIFHLCYRASRDGWLGNDFHDHCNHLSNTLVVVKTTTGYILGGYVETWWNFPIDPTILQADKNAFLFSLTNPSNAPQKLKHKSSDGRGAIFNKHDYGWYNSLD